MAERRRERNSNLELLRLLCILAIIGEHFTGQAGVSEYTSFGTDLFYSAVNSLSRVGCSVFIIISAWFSAGKEIKIRKVFHIWLTVSLYTIPLLTCMYYLGMVNKEELFLAFLPIEESPLWFAGHYILLVLATPLLNLLLKEENKAILEYILAVLFILLVLYPTITARLGFFSNDLFALIFLYLFTGYIKKYGSTTPGSRLALFVFLLTWGGLTFFRAFAAYRVSTGRWYWPVLQNYGEVYRARMQTLPNLIIAYSLFFTFQGMHVRNSKLINLLSSATLGVYCFHQVPFWYSFLWNTVFNTGHYTAALHGVARMMYTVRCVLLVWLLGTVVELIRNAVCQWLIESRVWYAALCQRIDAQLQNHAGGGTAGAASQRRIMVK